MDIFCHLILAYLIAKISWITEKLNEDEIYLSITVIFKKMKECWNSISNNTFKPIFKTNQASFIHQVIKK